MILRVSSRARNEEVNILAPPAGIELKPVYDGVLPGAIRLLSVLHPDVTVPPGREGPLLPDGITQECLREALTQAAGDL